MSEQALKRPFEIVNVQSAGNIQKSRQAETGLDSSGHATLQGPSATPKLDDQCLEDLGISPDIIEEEERPKRIPPKKVKKVKEPFGRWKKPSATAELDDQCLEDLGISPDIIEEEKHPKWIPPGHKRVKKVFRRHKPSATAELDDQCLENLGISPDIIEEEKRLKKQALRQEQKLLRELQEREISEESEAEKKEQRYKRLMHLLGRSSWYSTYMKEKLNQKLTTPAGRERLAANKSKPPTSNAVVPSNAKESPSDSKVSPSNLRTSPRNSKETPASSKTGPVASKDGRLHTKKRKAIYNIEDIIEDLNADEAKDLAEEATDKLTASQGIDDETYVNSMGFTVSHRQPKLFEGGVMRDYQLDAIEWLKILDGNSVNGILGDEMGLGKTIQVIGLLCHLVGQGLPGPYAVIAPLSTLPNWMSEFERFAPQLPVIQFHGNAQRREALVREFQKMRRVGTDLMHPIVVTSFQVPLVESRFFQARKWRYLIVDEGHRIKNHKTQLSLMLKTFSSVNRLILTGTPLQNNLAELWSLLHFLLPEIFNDLSTFGEWFDAIDLQATGAENEILEQEKEKKVLSMMHQILSPFLLRRCKSDVELHLPPKREILVYCPMTELQRSLYSAVLDRSILMMNKEEEAAIDDENGVRRKRRCVLRKEARENGYADADDEDDDCENWKEIRRDELVVEAPSDPAFKFRINMIMPQMVLRHVTNHPYLVKMPVIPGTRDIRVDEDIITHSGKMLVLDALLARLKQNGHKVLIFSNFTMVLDLLGDFAELRGYEYCRLDGSRSLESRKSEILRFNTDPDVFMFNISTRAGGLGLNLVAADTVIIYDSDWNPQCDLQAQDRCHRIGQTRPVVVYRLATAGTIDEAIIGRAAAKRKLEKMVIQKGAFRIRNKMFDHNAMDLVELKQLLTAKDHEREIHSNGYVFTDKELDKLLDRSDMMLPVKDDAGVENEKQDKRRI